MDEFNPYNLKDLIPESTVEKLLNPSAETIGDGIGAIVYTVMQPALMLGIWSQQNVNNFKQRLESKAQQTTLENYSTEKLNVAYTALKDLSGSEQTDDIKEMFANLIVNSLDKTKNHDFSSRISNELRQFSANDATVLNRLLVGFDEVGVYNAIPVFDLRFQNKDTPAFLSFKEDVVFTTTIGELNEPLALQNLQSSGIIIINDTNSISESDSLNEQIIKQKYETSPSVIKKLLSTPTDEFIVSRRSIRLTAFGRLFVSAIR